MDRIARILLVGLLAAYAAASGVGAVSHALDRDGPACGCDGAADCCGGACCAPLATAAEPAPSCCGLAAIAVAPECEPSSGRGTPALSPRCTCGDHAADGEVLQVAKHLRTRPCALVDLDDQAQPPLLPAPGSLRGGPEPDEPVPRSEQASA